MCNIVLDVVEQLRNITALLYTTIMLSLLDRLLSVYSKVHYVSPEKKFKNCIFHNNVQSRFKINRFIRIVFEYKIQPQAF